MKLETLDLKTLESNSPIGVERKRELAPSELPNTPEKSSLKRIRERHLTLARAVAEGDPKKTLKQIALEHGISPARLYSLSSDQTFKDLVAHFRAGLDVALESAMEKLVTLTDSALDELQRRLDEEPDTMTNGQLLQIMTAGADRTGHGPSSKSEVNVNVGFAAKLNEARSRMKTIDAKATKVAQKQDTKELGSGLDERVSDFDISLE